MSMFTRLAAAAAMAVALTTGADAATGCAVPSNANQLAGAIAQGLNAQRRANGLRALNFNPRLSESAQVHACDMARRNFFDHRGSDGSNVQNRARRVGYRDCLIAENLAWGYPEPSTIITGWMNSPGHRRNMLLRDVREFGIGITQGPRGPYWVLVVAKGC